ncbi:MAG: heme-binding protein, partial [Acidobacteriota bacterium]
MVGGGLPLYRGQTRIGGLGVSGDTACADHEIAKTVRDRGGMNPPSGRRPTTSRTAASTSRPLHPPPLRQHVARRKEDRYEHQRARIYMLVGEPEKALDGLSR